MHKTGAINFNVPNGTSSETTSISGFSGLNISDNPLTADSNTAADMLNVYLTLENTLSTRPRLKYIQKKRCKKMISCWKLDDGNILYHYLDKDDEVCLDINDQPVFLGFYKIGEEKIRCFQKNGNVYILSPFGYYYIDSFSVNLRSVYGGWSTYIPITEIQSNIDGSILSVKNEEENLLNNKFKRIYFWDGTSDVNIPDDGEFVSNEYYKEYEHNGLPYYIFNSTNFAWFKDGHLVISTIGDTEIKTEDVSARLGLSNVNNTTVTFSNDGSKLIVKTSNTELKIYDLTGIDYDATTTITPITYTTTDIFDLKYTHISNDGNYIWYYLKTADGQYKSRIRCAYKEDNEYKEVVYNPKDGEDEVLTKTVYDLLYDDTNRICYRLRFDAIEKYTLSESNIIKYSFMLLPNVIQEFNEPQLVDDGKKIMGFGSWNGTSRNISIITIEDTPSITLISNIGRYASYLSDNSIVYLKNNELYQVNPSKPDKRTLLFYASDESSILKSVGKTTIFGAQKIFAYKTVNKPSLTYKFEKEIKYEYIFDKNKTVLDNYPFTDLTSYPELSPGKLLEGSNDRVKDIQIILNYTEQGINKQLISEINNLDFPIPHTRGFEGTFKDSRSILGNNIVYHLWYADDKRKWYIKMGASDDGEWIAGLPEGLSVSVIMTMGFKQPIYDNFTPTLMKHFYNNYWFASDNALYNTLYNDPTYIPISNKSVIGDNLPITGINSLTDSSMVVYKADKQFVVSASSSNNTILYSVTEMKSDKGNLPVGECIVTSQTEYPLQFTNTGIYVLNIPKNVTTDTNTAVSISERIDVKYLGETNKENIITHNHLYWTYVIFPGETSKIYVLDNRTTQWYYWEVPINILSCWETVHQYAIIKDAPKNDRDPERFGETIGIQDNDTDWSFTRYVFLDNGELQPITYKKGDDDYEIKQYTETVFMTTTGETYEFKTIDHFDYEVTHTGTEYCDLIADHIDDSSVAIRSELIPWLWESQILPLTYTRYSKSYAAVGYSKQLQQTGFMFADSDRTEEYSLRYQFIVYRKHMLSRNIKDVPAQSRIDTLNYIRSVLKRTRVPKFSFIKIRLTNTDSINNRLNLISIKFKYKLLQEQV